MSASDTPNRSERLLTALEDKAASPTAASPVPRRGVFIIASPRPLAGKSFLARLVSDFLRVDGEAESFDLNPGAATPAGPKPPHRVDLGRTEDQVALFDRLVSDDGVTKVVDVGHLAYARFFDLTEQVGLIQEARRRGIEMVVLYAVAPHPSCAMAYQDLLLRFPRVLVVPVFNEAVLKGERLRDQYPYSRPAAVPIQVSTLAPHLKVHTDGSDNSFTALHTQHPVDIPIGPAFDLRSWTKRTFLEFRELELRLLLEKLRASLGQPDRTASAS